ncbi:MAG: hypothetical protein COS47_01735 [Candidatus Nealsonbacteria bacterium CG03_land_8_20_14_0_80_36_12]|uniref:Radical SAM core domain-containing protein n=1 Tax=Candidatus Nealsonbacteria bacterium CG03_land_8_20_14_0_80_36_12 TaxID=1974701 RepID=A0A2M7BY45_9BACT|nr:MAG: hypothetical protein COS47_01735 [Candidatus Nealsonbacteria bacterium CG03_land_8_20_14_0_80_36_12]
MKYIIKGLKNLVKIKKQLTQKQGILLSRMLGNYFFAFLKISENVPLPLEFQIEPSAVCNLRCQACSFKDSKKTDNSFLSKENFIKLIGEMAFIKTINFTGIGESLLNKNLSGLIKIAKNKKIQTLLITNGQLLNKKTVEDLLKSGLDKISISVESGKVDYYEKIRMGAKFEILKNNIILLEKAIKKNNSNLQVIINAMLLPETLKDISHLVKLIDLASLCKVNLITMQFPHNIHDFGIQNYFGKDKEKLRKTFNILKHYGEEKKIAVNFPSVNYKKGQCYYPWIYPQITSSGELLPAV